MEFKKYMSVNNLQEATKITDSDDIETINNEISDTVSMLGNMLYTSLSNLENEAMNPDKFDKVKKQVMEIEKTVDDFYKKVRKLLK